MNKEKATNKNDQTKRTDQVTTTTDNVKYLMEPNSGTVQTINEWYSTFLTTDSELWGGDEFKDANLVEVVWDEEKGYWVADKKED